MRLRPTFSIEYHLREFQETPSTRIPWWVIIRMKPKKKSNRNKSYQPKQEKKTLWLRSHRWELVILLAALACDLNSWGHQFVFDDTVQIVDAPLLQTPANFLKIFAHAYNPTSGQPGDLYRPLATLSFGVNYWLSGLHPDSFHAVNRALHVLTCLGIFWAIKRLTGPPVALCTALLFAVHPIQTEAITYITGRADALAMFFFIIAWLLFIRAREMSSSSRQPLAYSVAFYFFALLSKESSITWLGVVFLTELVYFSKSDFRTFLSNIRKYFSRVYAGYLATTLLYLLIRFSVLHGISGINVSFLDNPLAHHRVLVRVLTGLKVLFESIGLLCWPLTLSADYSYHQVALVAQWNNLAGMTILGLVALFLLTVAWTYGRFPNVFFGLTFFLTTYSVVSNLVIPIGTIRADRLLYMPALGILFIVAAALVQAQNRVKGSPTRIVFSGGFTLLLMLLAARTIWRNEDWRDGLTLWTATTQTSPRSAKAHTNLGNEYFKKKEYERALQEFRNAESIYSNDEELLNDMGSTLLKLGKTDEAISYFREALTVNPLHLLIRFNLAQALQAQGMVSEASHEFETIDAQFDDLIQKDPANPEHHYNKANALFFQGRLAEALTEYERTVQIDPNHILARKSIDLVRKRLTHSLR